MSSFDDVLQRVLRDEGWDVSPGPVEDSLIAEAGGERVLLQWGAADAGGGPSETITAQADARPADAGEAQGPETGEADDADAELLGADDGGEAGDAELLSADADEADTQISGPDDADADGAPSELLGAAAEASEAGGGRPGAEEPSGGGAEIIDATVDPDEVDEGAEGGEVGEMAVDEPDGAPSVEAGTEPAPESAPEAAGPEVADEVPEEVPVVRLRVDREEAADEARPKLVDIQETILELVPHRAFEYTCRVPDGTGDVETYRGHILLNALTEAAVTLEAPRFADGVPEGARLLEPEVDVDGAVAEARSHLEDRFTRDVQVEETTGNVSMMETRRVSPDADGIDLDAQGVWYVPVWRIEGENGTLRIDANRGEVLDESLQQETGTDAEWVA